MHVFITHLLIAIRQLTDLLSLLLVDVCETALLDRWQHTLGTPNALLQSLQVQYELAL